jgi:hypothetical protein
VAITLKEASFMKLFCDTYYLQKIIPAGLRAKKAAETSVSVVRALTAHKSGFLGCKRYDLGKILR